jgi:hypothetical protein
VNVNPSNPAANLSQLRDEISSALSSADARATLSVDNLQLVHQARLARLSRTAAALKAQYGPNDPQVIQAEASVAAASATVGRVSLAKQQVATPTPKVFSTGWALHGRVVDAQFQPLPGFTVFLVDAEKAYQSEYGFAYTDQTGYFLINYSGPASAARPAPAPQLFLQVADTKAQPVYLSTAPFQPAPGSITYQNHVLPSGDQPIGSPPDSVRKTAMPGAAQPGGPGPETAPSARRDRAKTSRRG